MSEEIGGYATGNNSLQIARRSGPGNEQRACRRRCPFIKSQWQLMPYASIRMEPKASTSNDAEASLCQKGLCSTGQRSQPRLLAFVDSHIFSRESRFDLLDEPSRLTATTTPGLRGIFGIAIDLLRLRLFSGEEVFCRDVK